MAFNKAKSVLGLYNSRIRLLQVKNSLDVVAAARTAIETRRIESRSKYLAPFRTLLFALVVRGERHLEELCLNLERLEGADGQGGENAQRWLAIAEEKRLLLAKSQALLSKALLPQALQELGEASKGLSELDSELEASLLEWMRGAQKIVRTPPSCKAIRR